GGEVAAVRLRGEAPAQLQLPHPALSLYTLGPQAHRQRERRAGAGAAHPTLRARLSNVAARWRNWRFISLTCTRSSPSSWSRCSGVGSGRATPAESGRARG